MKSNTGLSLNDTLKVGLTIQEDIQSVIVRFRPHPYVLIGDIQKMYRRFWVRPEDGKFQKIIWRDGKRQLRTYELNTNNIWFLGGPIFSNMVLKSIGKGRSSSLSRWHRKLYNEISMQMISSRIQHIQNKKRSNFETNSFSY